MRLSQYIDRVDEDDQYIENGVQSINIFQNFLQYIDINKFQNFCNILISIYWTQ